MKKLLLLSALFIFACSSDEGNNYNNNNNDDDDTAQLFLEKYDGVMWGEHDNDSSGAYWITFNSTGVTAWDRYDGLENCDVFTAVWGEADSEGDISTIQEETEDSLVVAVTCENDCEGFEDYTLTINVSANGNTMTLVDSDYPDETETFFRDNNVTTPPDGC